MKVGWVILLVTLWGTLGCVEQSSPSEQAGATEADSTELRFVRRVPEQGPPESLTLHPDSNVSPREFLDRFSASLWDLSPVDELRLVRSIKTPNGYLSQHYDQFHAGYPVENGRVTLTVSKDGKVIAALGKPLGGLGGASTEARISKQAAMGRARVRAAAACSLPESIEPTAGPVPRLIFSERHKRLVWQVPIVVREPKWVEWMVVLDAATGEVLDEWGGVGVGGQLPGCSPRD